MTISNGKGIKYSASSIRINQNLCVIRDNGRKMEKREVFRKKKKKKLKKQWKLERDKIFFSGEITLLITKQASTAFREKTALVSLVQLILISLKKITSHLRSSVY